MKIGLTLHMDADNIPDVSIRYQEQLMLVDLAEEVGLDCIWLTEHHGQHSSPTPRPELFIAHASARTKRINFGTAALLLGQRDPLDIAEIIAMLCVLAPNRIKIGLAKGGPFLAHKHIWEAAEQRGERLLTALPTLHVWLSGRAAAAHKKGQPVYLTPYVNELRDTPLYLATRDPIAIKEAARWGMGLMAAQFWSLARIRESIVQYAIEAGHTPPNLMIGRGIYIHEDENIARERALSHVQQVRARKQLAKRGGPEETDNATAQAKRGIDLITADNIDEFALVGSIDRILARLPDFIALGTTDLALNPMTDRTTERQEQLRHIGVLLQRYGQII
jgi:alkanesulfonate monooxygenase SsuD/methylene tetrahydromethanopterin reductase-like flavin-dependent oxidoreductase (luciferase family)